MADDSRIEPEFDARMNFFAHNLDEFFNGKARGADRKVGFVLGVFNFGELEHGRFNYISNADRADVVILLKEMVARFEGQPEVRGHG